MINSSSTLIELWKHECDRVFADKLVSLSDKQTFGQHLKQLCDSTFEIKHTESFVSFVPFLRDDVYDEDGILLEERPLVRFFFLKFFNHKYVVWILFFFYRKKIAFKL